MKRTQISSIIISLCAFVFVGCGNSIPEMDEETYEMVVECAAAAVRNNNEYYPSKLLDYQEVKDVAEEAVKAEADVILETENTIEAEVKEESSLIPDSDVKIIDKTEAVEKNEAPTSLDEVLELNDLTISYEGYEVKDFYPDGGEEFYFVMNATEGTRLLVAKFKLENLTQADVMADLIGKRVRYKIEVNGETKNALTTMLLNDLSNYQGNIAAGTAEELVLVCEVPIEQAEAIETLSLIVKSADETATISLN